MESDSLLQVQYINLKELERQRSPPKEPTPREKHLIRGHWTGQSAPAPAEAPPVHTDNGDTLGFAHDAETGKGPCMCLRLYGWIADEQQKRFGPWEQGRRPYSMLGNSYKHIIESGQCPLAGDCRHYTETLARREGQNYQSKMNLK